MEMESEKERFCATGKRVMKIVGNLLQFPLEERLERYCQALATQSPRLSPLSWAKYGNTLDGMRGQTQEAVHQHLGDMIKWKSRRQF